MQWNELDVRTYLRMNAMLQRVKLCTEAFKMLEMRVT